MAITGTKKKDDSKVGEYVERGKREAQERIEAAKGHTVDFVDARAENVGEALERVSTALRTASEAIETAGVKVGLRGESAADRVDEASKYLRKNEPDVFLNDLEDFSRRHMGWAIGIAFVAGFAVARLGRR